MLKGKSIYYLMGDFNCNMLPSSLNNVNTQALLNITDAYNLKQLVNEPKRVTPVSSTLIDIIFTSHPDNSCGSTRPFSHGKVRLYPWEVCVLCVTSIPTVKLPMGNHYGYIKKNKRITHDVSRSKS